MVHEVALPTTSDRAVGRDARSADDLAVVATRVLPTTSLWSRRAFCRLPITSSRMLAQAALGAEPPCALGAGIAWPRAATAASTRASPGVALSTRAPPGVAQRRCRRAWPSGENRPVTVVFAGLALCCSSPAH